MQWPIKNLPVIHALCYSYELVDGTMTATMGATVQFPLNDKYGPSFQTFIKTILHPDPKYRPTVKDIKLKCESMV
jgi:hypothetical protein